MALPSAIAQLIDDKGSGGGLARAIDPIPRKQLIAL